MPSTRAPSSCAEPTRYCIRPVISCWARKRRDGLAACRPCGSTDTAMICTLAATFGPHQVLRDAQVGGDQRADVRAVGVEERHQHRLAAVGADVDPLAEVVAQRERRSRAPGGEQLGFGLVGAVAERCWRCRLGASTSRRRQRAPRRRRRRRARRARAAGEELIRRGASAIELTSAAACAAPAVAADRLRARRERAASARTFANLPMRCILQKNCYFAARSCRVLDPTG